MKRLFTLLLVLFHLGIFGCTTNQPPQNNAATAPSSCENSIKTTANGYSVSGIEVPISTTEMVKIGEIKVTPEKLVEISDAVMQMEQFRKGQCDLLAKIETIPASDRSELLLNNAKYNTQYAMLVASLNNKSKNSGDVLEQMKEILSLFENP